MLPVQPLEVEVTRRGLTSKACNPPPAPLPPSCPSSWARGGGVKRGGEGPTPVPRPFSYLMWFESSNIPRFNPFYFMVTFCPIKFNPLDTAGLGSGILHPPWWGAVEAASGITPPTEISCWNDVVVTAAWTGAAWLR